MYCLFLSGKNTGWGMDLWYAPVWWKEDKKNAKVLSTKIIARIIRQRRYRQFPGFGQYIEIVLL